MFGIIYLYKSPSCKYYIGQTINPKKRKFEHVYSARHGSKAAFHNAIRKYGITSFEYTVLQEIESENKQKLKLVLDSLEKMYIRQFKSEGKILYNLTEGGDLTYDRTGEHLTQEQKNKIRQWALKYHASLSNEQKQVLKDKISKGRKKPILQYDKNGNFIKEWSSASDVPFAKQTAIVSCLRGYNKTCAGYIWKYKSEI